jgi:hypothetical protein
LHSVLSEIAASPGAQSEVNAPALGRAYQDVTALRIRSLATITALDNGTCSGPQVSIDKLLLSRAERSVHDLLDRVEPIAVNWPGDCDWEVRSFDFLHSRSASIYGGSAEIQKTVVATGVLGLPRAPR